MVAPNRIEPGDAPEHPGRPRPPTRAILLGRLALLAIAGALLLCGVIAIRSAHAALRTLHPPRQPVARPAPTGDLAGLTDVSFVTSDHLALRGWYVPSRNRAAVILTHGLGANRTQLLFEARHLARAGYGVLLFDWRAQGESDGDMVTWGDRERLDLRAALDFLCDRPDVDPHRIGAIGFSMGGFVVADVAARDSRLGAIAIEGTFTSLEDELRWDFGKWGPLSGLPAVWAVHGAGVDIDAVRPVDAIRWVHPRPVLLINGTNDPHAPLRMEGRLYQAASSPKSYWMVVGGHHGDYSDVEPVEYVRRLLAFFDGALLGPAGVRPT